MEDEDHPIVRRDRMIRSLLIFGLVLALAITAFVSNRRFLPTNRPYVAAVAPISERGELANFGDFIDTYAVIMPKAEDLSLLDRVMGKTQEDRYRAAPDRRPQLGYSYREVTAFGLPLIAYPEFGYVAFRDHPTIFAAVPLNADGLALLNRKAGKPLEAGFIFPFWRTCWGLLFIAWAGGIFWFHVIAERRRRRVLGLV